jgi:glycosyltransferase involved in cell wall biosynthesis
MRGTGASGWSPPRGGSSSSSIIRRSLRDYFCASSTRNTAFAYARAPHVAFVDDLSVLLPGWLKAHMHAASQGHVLAGTTCKHRNIQVDDHGVVVSYDEFGPGRDSRLSQITEDWQACGGSWLFGGTFSVPLELALKVNGQDEIHDTIGGEDYDFGIRLERAGGAVRISRSCGTFEDEDGHHTEAAMVRLDKPWAGPDGPFTSNYLLNKLLREPARSWTIGNPYDLRAVRDQVLAGGAFPEVSPGPMRHWADRQLLSEM